MVIKIITVLEDSECTYYTYLKFITDYLTQKKHIESRKSSHQKPAR